MAILTDIELNKKCLSVLENLKLKGLSIYSPIFELLYLHGFRANELQFWKEWTLEPDNNVIFKTSKKGNARIIKLDLLPVQIQNYVQTGNKDFYLTKYETLSHHFKKSSDYIFTNKNKKITTHLFRHNRIKLMNNQGFSKVAIQQSFGLQQLSTVDSYLNSQINARLKPF